MQLDTLKSKLCDLSLKKVSRILDVEHSTKYCASEQIKQKMVHRWHESIPACHIVARSVSVFVLVPFRTD